MLKSLLRRIKHQGLFYISSIVRDFSFSINGSKNKEQNPSCVFIIGCGRSGTTLLGDILSMHHDISYIYEPYYLWAAVNPSLDVLNLFGYNKEVLLFVDDDFYRDFHKVYFNSLIGFFSDKNAPILLEKTPLNVYRIGWLRKICPKSKFIHIYRNGIDVCSSIKKIAEKNNYKMLGLPKLHQWWGNNYSKWNILVENGSSAGYFPDEVRSLNGDFAMGAYEWITSLKEVEKWKEILGDNFYEICYEDFVDNPEETIISLLNFLEIDSNIFPFQKARKIIYPSHNSFDQPTDLSLLPVNIRSSFDFYQQKLGYHEHN